VSSEEAPTGGLTKTQKLVFAGAGVGVVAVIGLVVILGMKSSGDPAPADKRQANASGKTPPVIFKQPADTDGTVDQKTSPRSNPIERPPAIDGSSPEEDVGPNTTPSPSPSTRPTDPPSRTRPPTVTDEHNTKPTRRDPPEREPRSTETAPEREPRSTETAPADTRPSAPVETARMSADKIYERLLKSTVLVVNKDKAGRVALGSGSLVNREQRLVLTNFHMVEGVDEVYVSFPVYESGKLLKQTKAYLKRFLDNKFIRAKVVKVRTGQDIALVQLDDLPAGIPAVKLAPRSARPGEGVHSIGNPSTTDACWAYAPGKVRQVSHKTWKSGGEGRTHSLDSEVLETDSPTNHGDSGGPLVNDFMQLVGITQGGDPNARTMSLFIDQSEIRQLLKEQGIEEESAGNDTARPDNPVAEDLVKGLKSGDARARAQAAARLADLGPDARNVLQQLIRALEDSDRNVRKQAANAILQTGLPERGDIQRTDLGALRACLRDETASGEMQRWAMKAIALLGENGKAAVAEVTALVKSEDKETRLAALIALEKMGSASPAVIADAGAGLKTDDRKYNCRLAIALTKLDFELKTKEGKTAVDTLIAFQKPTGTSEDKDKEVMALANEAIKALSSLGKAALPQVRKALKTYSGGTTIEETVARAAVRSAMIRVLVGMADKAAAADPDLRALEASDPVLPIRDQAHDAREKIRPGR
jgi:S1-C subfamily serine protease/HEAT repeat protein